jgi:hypothetical protein
MHLLRYFIKITYPIPAPYSFSHKQLEMFKSTRQYTNNVTDWATGIRFPAGAENDFIHHHVQIVAGAHPASYPLRTGVPSSRCKAAGA